MTRRGVLAAPLVLGGCAILRRRHRPAAATPLLRPVVGPPYQAGGIWRYPRASYAYDQTGLAVVTTGHSAFATDGAPWDPTALIGAHPTLQLPSVVSVTNLDTGRSILLRLDDRGPESAARLLAVTPRAALLLGPGSTPGVLRVRVRIEEALSRQLTDQLGDLDAPPLAVTAAPAGDVQSQPLAPLPGSVGRTGATSRPIPSVAQPAAAAPVPLRLPEAVTQFAVEPTELWIDAGGVGGPRYAGMLRDRLGGLGAIVVRDPQARPEDAYRVRIGPLADVAAADDMLDRVLRGGVVDGRIILL